MQDALKAARNMPKHRGTAERELKRRERQAISDGLGSVFDGTRPILHMETPGTTKYLANGSQKQQVPCT
jgi:hypothetical protein